MVLLKRISRETHPSELEIATMFSSEPLRSHPKNHCIPILEVLDVVGRNDRHILVMPLLHDYISPRFETVGEAVEFFRQIFEVRFWSARVLPNLDASLPVSGSTIHA